MKPAFRKLLAALADDEVTALKRRLADVQAANDRLAAENQSLGAEVARLQRERQQRGADQ